MEIRAPPATGWKGSGRAALEKLIDAGMAAQLAGAVGVGPLDVGTDVAGGATVVGGADIVVGGAGADVVGAGGAVPRRH